MKKELEIRAWNILKTKLKRVFPRLTSADLAWRNSTKHDLFSNVANRLGITQRELSEIIKLDDQKEYEKDLELLKQESEEN